MEVTDKPKRPALTPEQRQRRAERARLLKSLVYEMWDGKPVYYAGYQDVIEGTKTVEQLMSSSILQSRSAVRLSAYLLSVLDLDIYDVLGNELGIQFKKGDWRACNVAIFELKTLEGQDDTKYAWVPPKVAIKIDTKADMSRFDEPFEYYEQKTSKLLEFGAEKVIWLFTKSKKVWIAEPDKDWVIRDWNQPVDVLPNCQFVPDELIARSKKWKESREKQPGFCFSNYGNINQPEGFPQRRFSASDGNRPAALPRVRPVDADYRLPLPPAARPDCAGQAF